MCYTHLPSTNTQHTTVVLIAGVVLLFLWSPLMDHRPLKQVSPSLAPSLRGWCLFAWQQREKRRRSSWNIILPSCSYPHSLCCSEDCQLISVTAWLMSSTCIRPSWGHVLTVITRGLWGLLGLPCFYSALWWVGKITGSECVFLCEGWGSKVCWITVYFALSVAFGCKQELYFWFCI